MVRTQIQLTEAQWETLRRLSDEKGVSVAEIIRRSLDRTLRSTAQDTEDARLVRVMTVIGKYRSGLGDVARDHDRYLDEAYHE